MCLSKTQCFAPNGARSKFPTVAVYKHLAPNGAEYSNGALNSLSFRYCLAFGLQEPAPVPGSQ